MSKLNIPHSFEKAWQKRFEGYAAHAEDDAGIAGWSPTGLTARLRRFIDIWKSNTLNKDLWLDAGCGAGTYSRFIACQGSEVVGLDYSFPSLRKAQEKGGSSIEWCAADINCLPVKSGIFDGVICFGVTQALDNSVKAIQNLSVVIKPGGHVWVDALNGWCLPHLWERIIRRISKRPVHLRYESPHNIRCLMRDSGLTNIKLYWVPILPTRWSQFQWIVETNTAKWIFHNIPFVGLLLSHAFILCGERPQNG